MRAIIFVKHLFFYYPFILAIPAGVSELPAHPLDVAFRREKEKTFQQTMNVPSRNNDT